MLTILFRIFKVVFLIFFPFILLIRGAVYVHSNYELHAWPSILASVIFTSLLLVIYFTIFYGKITGRIGGVDALKKRSLLALAVVLGYCIYGILFVNTKNLKNPELRKEMTEVHPIIRLATSSLVYLDKDLIVTDAKRSPEDYRTMGLQAKKHSLHYKQQDGYSYALDLRTKGRSEFRNTLTSTYFKAMGFNVLRHGGTADHLHVSLFNPDRPNSK